MRLADLIRHLKAYGCNLEREGGSHSIYRNPANGQKAAVPRHREINDYTARKICDELGVPRL